MRNRITDKPTAKIREPQYLIFDKVYLLTYWPETRVMQAPPDLTGLRVRRADKDERAWGRVLVAHEDLVAW